MAQSEITIEKNGVSVTLYSVEVDDELSNKLFQITPPQANNNQNQGAKNPKNVNLLRVTRTIVITGMITAESAGVGKPTSVNSIKKRLMYIALGAGENGGLTTLNYDGLGRKLYDPDNNDATSIEGVIEKVAFNEKPSDEPSSTHLNFAKFTVQLTFLEGEIIG